MKKHKLERLSSPLLREWDEKTARDMAKVQQVAGWVLLGCLIAPCAIVLIVEMFNMS